MGNKKYDIPDDYSISLEDFEDVKKRWEKFKADYKREREKDPDDDIYACFHIGGLFLGDFIKLDDETMMDLAKTFNSIKRSIDKNQTV